MSIQAIMCSQILDKAIMEEVRRRGARVMYKTPYTATLEYGNYPNHTFHLIATVLTCGLWAPIWILLACTNRPDYRELLVDENGQLWWR